MHYYFTARIQVCKGETSPIPKIDAGIMNHGAENEDRNREKVAKRVKIEQDPRRSGASDLRTESAQDRRRSACLKELLSGDFINETGNEEVICKRHSCLIRLARF